MAYENPLDSLLPDVSVSPKMPYSQQDITEERDKVMQRTEQVQQEAGSVIDGMGDLDALMQQYNSQLPDALSSLDNARKQQADLNMRKKVTASAASSEARALYEKTVSKEGQEALAREQQEYYEARDSLTEAERKVSSGNVLDKIVGFFQASYYKDKVKRERQDYVSAANAQMTAAQTYVGTLEANSRYAQDVNAVDQARLDKVTELAQGTIKMANKANESVGKAFNNVAKSLGIKGQALETYKKRLNLMEQANSNTVTAHTQQLQQAMMENKMETSKAAVKKAKKDDDVYQQSFKQFKNFYSSLGKDMTEADFQDYISSSDGMTMQKYGGYVAHITAEGTSMQTQPVTNIYNKSESGQELTPAEQRQSFINSAAIQHNNTKAEEAWEKHVAESPNAGLANDEKARQQFLQKNNYIFDVNNPKEQSKADAVVNNFMANATTGEQVNAGLVTVPAAEDFATSPELKNSWKSYLTPELQEAIDKGEIPEDLEITSDTAINKKPIAVVDSVFKNIAKSTERDLRFVEGEDAEQVDKLISSEAKKIAAYYTAAQRSMKAQYDYAGDLKFPAAGSLGISSPTFDFTNEGNWALLMRKKFQEMRNHGSIGDFADPRNVRLKQMNR